MHEDLKTKTEIFAESLQVKATESIETITSAEEFKDLEEIIRFLSEKETILNLIQKWRKITLTLEQFQGVLQRQYSNNGQFKKFLFAVALLIGGANTLSATFAGASTSEATSVFSTLLQTGALVVATALFTGSGYYASLLWTGDELKKLQWQLEKDVQTCEEMRKNLIQMQGRFRECPRAKIELVKLKNRLRNRWCAIKTSCEEMLEAAKR